MNKVDPIASACILMLGAAIIMLSLLVGREPDVAAMEHQAYCDRVAAHELDPAIGHRDWRGEC